MQVAKVQDIPALLNCMRLLRDKDGLPPLDQGHVLPTDAGVIQVDASGVQP
jgi:hypothetical protein